MKEDTVNRDHVPQALLELFKDRDCITVAELAKVLGQNYPHVLRQVQAGSIPAINIGTQRTVWRIYEEPIVRWFADRHNRHSRIGEAE